MSHDIGDTCLRSSATSPSSSMLGHAAAMSKARLVITALFVDQPDTGAEVAAPTACTAPGSTTSGPATRPRARPHSSPAPGARRPHRPRPRRDRRADRAGPQGARRGRPGRRPRDHRLAPAPPPPDHACPGSTISRDPGPRRAGDPGAEQAAEVLLHPLRSRRSPTRPGSPTSPTTGSPAPTADPARTSRSSAGSTTAPATPCTSPRTPGSPAPIVLDHLPRSRCPARDSRIHAHRQRDGLHRPTRRPRPPRRQELLRGRAQRAWHIVQKNSRPNHPTTCGKAERFQQTMKKWLRAQPVQPTTIAELQSAPRPSSPTSTTTERRTDRCPTAPPRPPPTTPRPRPCPADRPRHRHPRPDPPRQRRQGRHGHPAHTPADCATSASAEPTPEPTSSCSSRTSTSAIVNAATGELLRELIIDPSRDYQPTGAPKGPAQRPPK